eukprot:TRINITY_DN908_c4_g1_i1.p2 TRINITY_DN908_c4_g1~~TRINITY_DN908_c4_g1_i1.p2  ORF type:complete len:737 (+),score=329.25 TRINITY_DN908_c4_g1_i1:97-2307(+)
MAAAHTDPAATQAALRFRDESLQLDALPAKLPAFDRLEFENTCKRRFFFGSSFGADDYAVAGLYDLGPVVTQVKANVMRLWRSHFVLEESMFEIETTAMTPGAVFDTSGHTERFADVMVKDMKTGECIRIDKYIEEWTDKELHAPDAKKKYSAEQLAELAQLQITADGMSIPEFKAVIEKWGLLSPKGNPLSEPHDFNMMFPTKIGPEGDKVGFLRPELAQGIILNFKRLLEFGNDRMPFAAAAMGPAFRNEIAPRQNLIRVREFFLAEIEHFCDPDDKSHPKFAEVRDVELWAWPKGLQEAGKGPAKMTVGEAFDKGIIANETLAYFIARVKMFMHLVGVRYVRFRQHRSNEMAHYACDCWDAECLTGWGWIECVGIADRSCYDLSCHAKRTKVEFQAYEKFAEPRVVDCIKREINKQAINKELKRDAKRMLEYLTNLPDDEAMKMDAELEKSGSMEVCMDGKPATVKRAYISCKPGQETTHGRSYTPSVIEPSFGIGRIIYAMLEQSYWVRRDDCQGRVDMLTAAREAAAAEAAATAGMDPELARQLTEAGEKVRNLKEGKAPKDQIDAAVAELKRLKQAAGIEEPKKEKKEKAKEKAAEPSRAVFSLATRIACYKVALLPLSPSVFRQAYCKDALATMRSGLVRADVTFNTDTSGQSIGRKYARMDEIGVPFCVTIDTDFPSTSMLTLRERDSTRQVFIPAADIVRVLVELCTDLRQWSDCLRDFKEKEGTSE